MPGTPLAYDSTKTLHGPTDLWGKLAIPGAAAEITLHTDGTPESVANPTAKHVGMLKTGATLIQNATVNEKSSDNFPTPYAVSIATQECRIEGDFLQMTDMDLVVMLTLGGTKTVPTNKEKITYGSLQTVSYMSAAAIWLLEGSSTLYGVYNLYRCYNASGFNAAMNRNEDSAGSINLVGTAITTRAAADQVAALWKQTA